MMMKISAVSYSVCFKAESLSDWEAHLRAEISKQIQEGAKIILYPELFLLTLTDYFSGDFSEQQQKISSYTQELLARISQDLKGHDVLLCLGSGPNQREDGLYNTSFVWVNGHWGYQDKMNLTPWESGIEPGTDLHIFHFQGFKVAVVICFDIEQPSIASLLKEEGIDIVLCPSATVNKNGNERINRCASGRSIELGALVVTAPLVGQSECEMIDHNEGRQGFFLPAQEVTTSFEQEVFSPYSTKEYILFTYDLSTELLQTLKIRDDETKPYFKQEVPVRVVDYPIITSEYLKEEIILKSGEAEEALS